MKDIQVARGLGWTSLVIAALEIVGQGTVERKLLGVNDHPLLMRALGVREAVAGLTILSQRRITKTLAAGLWSRVAGDAMDLALLATVVPFTRKTTSLAANAAVVLGITALDLCYAVRIQQQLSVSNGRDNPRRVLNGRTSVASRFLAQSPAV